MEELLTATTIHRDAVTSITQDRLVAETKKDNEMMTLLIAIHQGFPDISTPCCDSIIIIAFMNLMALLFTKIVLLSKAPSKYNLFINFLAQENYLAIECLERFPTPAPHDCASNKTTQLSQWTWKCR